MLTYLMKKNVEFAQVPISKLCENKSDLFHIIIAIDLSLKRE